LRREAEQPHFPYYRTSDFCSNTAGE